MPLDDSTRTSPTLLRRSADWQDDSAWRELVARYDPLIQSWCRDYRLDDAFAEEVTQLFWIELSEKMRSFSYDPSRRFRGWLRRAFHWRVLDALHERRRDQTLGRSLDDPSVEAYAPLFDFLSLDEDDHELTPRRLHLLELAGQIQTAVRDKVLPQTWQAFWHIAIDGWSTRQTADALEMSYLAAFAAHKRVSERLRSEGSRRLAEAVTGDDERRGSRR